MKPHKKKRPVRRSFVPSYSSWVRNVQTPLILLIFPLQHIYRDVKTTSHLPLYSWTSPPLCGAPTLLVPRYLSPLSCLFPILQYLSLSLSHIVSFYVMHLSVSISLIFSLSNSTCAMDCQFISWVRKTQMLFLFTWYHIFKLFDPIILVRTRVMFLS